MTSWPSCSSVAMSGPKIFSAMSAFTPETTSSRRMAIGCVKLNVTPGITDSASAIASMSVSFVWPLVHWSCGCRLT